MLSRRDRKTSAQRYHYLVFRLADQVLALPAKRVVRVAELTELIALPSELPWNLGVIKVRRVVLPLVALDLLLEMGPGHRPVEFPFPCVLARFEGGVAAFPVQALLGFETVYQSDGLEEASLVKIDQIKALR